MFFRWWKRRRRRRLIERPFPQEWLDLLHRNVYLYRFLSEPETARVRAYLQIFLAEKNWEGCGGLAMTDEIRVTIAAQVALLVLGLNDQYFDRVQSVLVYPDAYVSPETTFTPSGIVLEGETASEGEAWYRGPIVLSWSDVLAGAQDENDGHNLVFHEFAHQLDMLNGDVADGIPPMDSTEQYERWTEVMKQTQRLLVRDCERGRAKVLDCYGTTDLSELFAVATEAFFQRPGDLRHHHADLYESLRGYYRQDPASRSIVG
jgi:Mlc titration factor MtfA (ptsG expression regulator)